MTRSVLRVFAASDWDTQLAHQTLAPPDARRCLEIVLNAFGRALDGDPDR